MYLKIGLQNWYSCNIFNNKDTNILTDHLVY